MLLAGGLAAYLWPRSERVRPGQMNRGDRTVASTSEPGPAIRPHGLPGTAPLPGVTGSVSADSCADLRQRLGDATWTNAERASSLMDLMARFDDAMSRLPDSELAKEVTALLAAGLRSPARQLAIALAAKHAPEQCRAWCGDGHPSAEELYACVLLAGRTRTPDRTPRPADFWCGVVGDGGLSESLGAHYRFAAFGRTGGVSSSGASKPGPGGSFRATPTRTDDSGDLALLRRIFRSRASGAERAITFAVWLVSDSSPESWGMWQDLAQDSLAPSRPRIEALRRLQSTDSDLALAIVRGALQRSGDDALVAEAAQILASREPLYRLGSQWWAREITRLAAAKRIAAIEKVIDWMPDAEFVDIANAMLDVASRSELGTAATAAAGRLAILQTQLRTPFWTHAATLDARGALPEVLRAETRARARERDGRR